MIALQLNFEALENRMEHFDIILIVVCFIINAEGQGLKSFGTKLGEYSQINFLAVHVSVIFTI